MISYIESLKYKIINGGQITKLEALDLYRQPLSNLRISANQLRKHFCSNQFDVCTIINGKSGRCSEDCKFCAQSSYNHTSATEYPLLATEEIVAHARHHHQQGVLRYSIVTSGRRLSDAEINQMCDAIQQIRKEVGISVCISFGLLNERQYRKLKDAGATRVHSNLETSQRNFPNICTTHTFDDKISTIKAAQAAGLSVCSGGIIGLGETLDDRIDMAFSLRKLNIKNVPLNMLHPIDGTPLGKNKTLSNEDMQRIVAIYRFILPTATIRLAGGRELLEDKGAACFLSGANAAISGDMLTTTGITVETDMELVRELGYVVPTTFKSI